MLLTKNRHSDYGVMIEMIRRLSSAKMNAIWIYLIIMAFGTESCLGERASMYGMDVQIKRFNLSHTFRNAFSK